jgi:hypothetical protein
MELGDTPPTCEFTGAPALPPVDDEEPEPMLGSALM